MNGKRSIYIIFLGAGLKCFKCLQIHNVGGIKQAAGLCCVTESGVWGLALVVLFLSLVHRGMSHGEVILESAWQH